MLHDLTQNELCQKPKQFSAKFNITVFDNAQNLIGIWFT